MGRRGFKSLCEHRILMVALFAFNILKGEETEVYFLLLYRKLETLLRLGNFSFNGVSITTEAALARISPEIFRAHIDQRPGHLLYVTAHVSLIMRRRRGFEPL
jgi:hypothetical protein